MKSYLFSFAVGLGVGLLYATLRVKSPAPPLIALLGLLHDPESLTAANANLALPTRKRCL